MKELVAALTSKQVTDIIDQIAVPFKDVPHLPQGVVEFLVKITPWLAGLGGVLGVLSGLNMLSTGFGMQNSVIATFAQVPTTYFIIAGVLQLISAGILLLAFNPLKNMEKEGWIMMFWNMAISIAMMLVGIVFGGVYAGSLVGMAIGIAIGLYLMFEVRSSYK